MSQDLPALAGVNRIYICERATCGLRFPVHANDRFDVECPRCGGTVRCVASTPAESLERQEANHGPPAYQLPCPLHLLLDNWRSLFNVGSAFRTADGAGVAHLHLCGITATPDNKRLAKTALQAERRVDWDYAPDAVVRAQRLHAEGATLWALEMTPSAEPLFDVALPAKREPLVLMLGNEVNGLDPGLLDSADATIYVPMYGYKRSLNVAIAASVATYWLVGRAVESKRHALSSWQ